MKIIITGGGTGGHIYTGISLARTFQKKDSKNEIIFVGTDHGMEAELIPREGFQFHALKVKGIRREICLESFYAIILFFVSLVTALKLIKKIKPDVVIGTGGYVSGSVALISSMSGIPTFIHEQNAIPGITNKFLSLTCRKVFISFSESKDYFWKKEKTVYLGNPVRENIWQGNKDELIRKTNLVDSKKTILVFGGSKGARTISHTFLDCLNMIDESHWGHWQIIIISGKDDYTLIKEKLVQSKFKENMHVFPYLYKIENAYDLADLVICRAGATTVAEITAKGLPAILIPYPYATGDHQLFNARLLQKKKAAVVITERELTEKRLAEEVSGFMEDEKKITIFTQNSRSVGNRKAAEDIVNLIYDNIKK